MKFAARNEAKPPLATDPRILFIDDAPDLGEIFSELLSSQGFSVVTAQSYPEAIGCLHQSDFQLVLSDFRMDEVQNPWTVLSDIREAAGPVPVGIVTGWNLTEAEVQQRGFAFLLRKPFDAELLFAAVGQHAPSAPLADSHARIIRAYFAALTNRDWDGLASLCTEDVHYHLPGNDPQFSKSIQGRQEFREFSEATFRNFREAAFFVHALIPLPRAAVARYRAHWMASPTERVEAPGSVVFHFRADAICQIGVRLELKQLLARASDKP